MAEYPARPEDSDYEQDVLGFIDEAIQEADSFLRAQPRYGKITEAQNAIHSKEENRVGAGYGPGSNRTAKNAEDLVSGLTDTRNFWEYRSFNPNCQKQTEILGKISLHLWLQERWDMRWADMIRGCVTGGTSYAHMTWDSTQQELAFSAENVRDVLPIRPADFNSIQSAFGVILRRERTVNYMRAKYPKFESFFTPERDGSVSHDAATRYERVMERLGSPFRQQLFGGNKPAKEIPRIPTLDEFTCYLDDKRINKTREDIYMGNWHLKPVENCPECESSGTPHALNNWSYIVKRGQPIYPNKRLIVATRNKILYDNTSPYWHGLYPMPKLTLSPWDDTYIGKGLIWDILPLQRFMDKILRLIDNHFDKWMQPDFIGDKNSLSVSEFQKVNTARAGQKYRYNPAAGKGIELRYPDQLPQYIFTMLEWVTNEMSALSGAHDMSSVLQLGQLPSADAVERIMEAMTPQVRLRSRVIEAFTREFAMITASNICQFWTIGKRIAVLGPNGATMEDFDYDPGIMIPDFIHSSDFDERGNVTPAAMQRGPMPKMDRGKEMLRMISMHIAPGSLLSASEIQQKLLYMTLSRDGMLDIWTLLDKLGIPNVGEPPAGADTVTARLAVMAQMGLGPGAREGRPPTAQEMPKGVPNANGSLKISESG